MSGRPTHYHLAARRDDAIGSEPPKRVDDSAFIANLARYSGYPAFSEIRRPRGRVTAALPVFYPLLDAR